MAQCAFACRTRIGSASTGARTEGHAIPVYEPLYSLAGLLVGTLVGLTGVGGGSLMTPILVLIFNFHPATAVGTDLLFASVTKTVGTAVHGRRKTVDWTVVGRLAAGSVPAAVATLFVLSHSGGLAPAASGILGKLLGVALVITGITVLFRPLIVAWAARRTHRANPRRVALYTILLGVVLGILVSVTSVGAGAMGITALLILYPLLPMARIAGSDIAHAVPLTLIAGLGHWWIGAVDFNLLFSLLVGSIPGVIIGSHLGSRASDSVLRPVLAVTLLVVGGRLLA